MSHLVDLWSTPWPPESLANTWPPLARCRASLASTLWNRCCMLLTFALLMSGNCTFQLVKEALGQFPECGVQDVIVCPKVRSLEEIKLIVEKAESARGMVAFTFASPGMSRFMRQQCELAGIRYADLFQPVLVAMELYLNHPFFGVPGGLDLKALAEAELRWECRRVS
mmetsp:Transcript_30589/g.101779  ORF Transcript_30589/g.101779 Transcript_30589/m.101779 type:complete len:168 (-) Transcript_30589:46-549(-)